MRVWLPLWTESTCTVSDGSVLAYDLIYVGDPNDPTHHRIDGSADYRDWGTDLLPKLSPTSQLLEQVAADRAVRSGKIQAEVEHTLNQARKNMNANGNAVRQSLKGVLDNVVRAPELAPSVRAQLRDRIVSALREAGRQQVINDERRRQAEANMAIGDEARRLADELTDKRQ